MLSKLKKKKIKNLGTSLYLSNMTIANILFNPKATRKSTRRGNVTFPSNESPFSLFLPLPPSSFLHSKQLSIQNRDANLTSRKLIPQRCATSGFKGWQPWWDLIRREEKCRCTGKTRGRGVDGEADGERFKGRQGTEGTRPRGRRSHLRARKRFPLSMEV